tara:strand:+ start:363 stop:602 length:240 start_codon:yes stop_codon:yes gene_type:complete
MELKRFFQTETGKIIMSILLGLGIATLFRKTCRGSNCIKFKAPSKKQIDDTTYKYGENCFNYKIKTTDCDSKKTNIRFA